jgi:hypothetical protein
MFICFINATSAIIPSPTQAMIIKPSM